MIVIEISMGIIEAGILQFRHSSSRCCELHKQVHDPKLPRPDLEMDSQHETYPSSQDYIGRALMESIIGTTLTTTIIDIALHT